jgi:L-fuculokinase
MYLNAWLKNFFLFIRVMMSKQNVIAIFDVGKTNKKLLLFDEQYKILSEESGEFEETKDEDGFPCEDLQALTQWIRKKYRELSSNTDYNLMAVNFSAYGASLVHLADTYKPLTPLYNYLKPYPEKLKKKFYDTYGGESLIAKQTASPVLGSLNSGMQLYRLKYEQPEVFTRLKYSLHLPQYLSFIISSIKACDITSVGCHTQLWDFEKNKYHQWVYAEKMRTKFPAICRSDKIVHILNDTRKTAIGIGLHDSSAALIPYLKLFSEPFILLSTGTWCISLNPFNYSMLTDHELHNDCLCYLTYEGKPVKASRLFAGHEHEEQVEKLAEHFHKDLNYYKNISYDSSLLNKLQQSYNSIRANGDTSIIQKSAFVERSLADFETYEEAYHQLISDIMVQQVFSTRLVLAQTGVKKIFVDGGFGRNDVYMNLLASSFPPISVYVANISQASSLGAALLLHDHLSKKAIPSNLIKLRHYTMRNDLAR